MKVSTYDLEFIEGKETVLITIALCHSPIDQLLQLDVREVASNHHLQYGEQFSVRNVTIIIDIVDLEGKLQLLLV